MNQHPLWKPKFLVTAFVQLSSCLALFSGHLDGGAYVAVSTLTLATFTAGSVTENRLMK